MRWRTAFLLAVVIAAVGGSPASAGGGCHEPIREGSGATVRLRSMCFDPGVVRIQPGETVTWINDDSIEHVVMGTRWGTTKEFGLGDHESFTFESAGLYPYTCFLHAGMNGVVVVGDGTAPATADLSEVRVRQATADTSVKEPASGSKPRSPGKPDTPLVPLPFAAAGLVASAFGGYGAAVLRKRMQRQG